MAQSGDALEIVARVDYRTLDEFEAGFSDRLDDDALFLARQHIVTPAQDVTVGTQVRISIALPSGAHALTVDGTVAWAYPRDRVPPGREAGVGVRIDTISAEATERVARMRRRPSAGSRVRAPGQRLLARASRIPTSAPAFASLTRAAVAAAVTPAIDSAPAPAAAPDAPAPSFGVLHPPAPTPRVMGLLVDQSFDPTPAPQPLPHFLDSHPPLPLPALDAPSAQPIAELPDAPAHQPAGAFDERRTDVDLLASLASVDLVAIDGDEARAALATENALPPVVARPPRLADADPTGAFKVDELPSADAELVLEANPALMEQTLGGELGPGPDVEPVTAEADEVPIPSSQEWEARTEHGQTDLPSTAEAMTTSESERSAIARPLPAPESWPPWPPLSTEPMGVAFLVSFRRKQPVAAVESFTWPTHTTKRVGKFELAREEAEPEPDLLASPAITNPALEEATVDGFERGVTDPALSFGGVIERVDRAVELAARDADESVPPAPPAPDANQEDPDSVFAAGPVVVRPAMPVGKQAAVDGVDAAAAGHAEVTSDELRRPSGYADDDDADTDFDLVRPNLAGRLSRR
jgi:hypothetical protein